MKPRGKLRSFTTYAAHWGVALIFSACGSSGSGTSDNAAQGASTGSSVTISNFAFQPQTITVSAGTTVTWTDADSVAHTSTSDASGWNSGNINPGQSFSLQFTTSGTFTYHCNIHPGMTGTVMVQ